MKTNQITLFFLSLILFGLISCQDKKAINDLSNYKQKETLENKNIELAIKSIKFLDASDYDSLRAICTEDFKMYFNSTNESMSFNEFIPLHKMFYSAFPDYSHKIENILASGDYVIAQFVMTGTHKGEFYGIPPASKKIEYKGIQILKICEDKLESVYAVEDGLTMMKQLGLEPK